MNITVHNATGELDIRRDPFILGTRVLLTCVVTGLHKGSVVLYKWYHKCPGCPNRIRIQNGAPYYRVVSDTLLVDVTFSDRGGRYYCTIQSLQNTEYAITRNISVAG